MQGLGGGSGNLLQSVGDAYKNALDDTSANAVPLFGVFLGAIILAIGAFVLWLEMIIRDAAIYIALFFLPLTFVAMIWPATSRWARRLVEFLVAVILAKFVIVAIIGLASAAITQTSLAQPGDGSVFERMIAGAALLVLAAWSPFGLLRLIPMMEVAAGERRRPARRDVGRRQLSRRPQPRELHAAGDGSAIARFDLARLLRRAADRLRSAERRRQRRDRVVRTRRTTSGGARAGAASTGASRAAYARSSRQRRPLRRRPPKAPDSRAARHARQRHRGRRPARRPRRRPTSPA